MKIKPKVIILCGGAGTRLREETEFKPKPLVEIGDKPILWHIMKIYSHYGFNDFILSLGYKGEMIKNYFLNYEYLINDFTLNLSTKKKKVYFHENKIENWNITFVDTGNETNTGGRIFKLRDFVDDIFFATYGDGVANINIKNLLDFHLKNKKISTLTAVHPVSKYGSIELRKYNVTEFKEKPELQGWINGGFFVFNKEIFQYLNDNCVLEDEPLKTLAKKNQLSAYLHGDFWQCMDTYKDVVLLNNLWKNKSPWKMW